MTRYLIAPTDFFLAQTAFGGLRHAREKIRKKKKKKGFYTSDKKMYVLIKAITELDGI